MFLLKLPNLKRHQTKAFFILATLLLQACGSNVEQNDLSHSKNNNNTVRNKTKSIDTANFSQCLKETIKFADTVQFDANRRLYDQLKRENFSLDNCDTKKLADDIFFQKSIIKIILKIYLWEIKADYQEEDLMSLNGISSTTAKIAEAYTYILYKKHNVRTEILYSGTVRFIKLRDNFKNDPDLMALLAECDKAPAKVKSRKLQRL